MDSLEKNIKTLQEDFQRVEQPDRLAIWNGVSLAPQLKTGFAHRLNWRLAAAAIALLLVGTGLGYWWNESQHNQLDAARFADLPPEWQAKVRACEVLIGHQEEALQVNQPKGAIAADELRELQVLDSLQQIFWTDFQALPKDQRTAERFLHYYEQKSRILELILKEIKIRNHESEKHALRQI